MGGSPTRAAVRPSEELRMEIRAILPLAFLAVMPLASCIKPTAREAQATAPTIGADPAAGSDAKVAPSPAPVELALAAGNQKPAEFITQAGAYKLFDGQLVVVVEAVCGPRRAADARPRRRIPDWRRCMRAL